MTIISALALPALVGFVALVAEFGHGLVTRAENQRVADLAAFAGASAYAASNSTATMTAAAQSVAALNGVAASQTSVSLVASPRTATNQAVNATVATSNVLLLAPVLKFGTSLPVTARAYAEIGTPAPACLLALAASGTGVTLSGGTAVSAPTCAVASNATVAVPCGTTITAKSVLYNAAAPSQPCGGITASVVKAAAADPLAGMSAVTAAAAHASALAALTAPSAPVISVPPLLPTRPDLYFGYNPLTSTVAALLSPCVALLLGSWTVTCPILQTYYFGNITVAPGMTVNFNTFGVAAATFNINGAVTNNGSALNFGPGTYNIANGIVTAGGSRTTFGAGTFNIGQATGACNGAGLYSICNTGTSLTFAGPSTFVLSAGVYNAGGSTLALGSGTGNSFNIGPSSTGNAVLVGGGSNTTFADASGTGNLFQLVGNFNVASGGGSCMTIGAAAQHDIDGYFSSAGGTTLGAGIYSVENYIALGANGGGDVSCNGSTVGIAGTGVTLVTAGASTLMSSPCAGTAFCVAAGYSNISLTAPTSGTYQNLAVIGPVASSNAASAVLTEGASNTSISGAVYFPYGPLTLSGGASIGNQAGQCLQIVASQITLSGGTRASASSCFSGASGSGSVAVVQ